MKFAIQINEGPYQHQASDTAYQFAKAALANGHEVMRVFFYHDGVNNSTRLTSPPQDDRNIVNRWAELGKEHKLDLVVCVAAAQRRGIVDDREAKSNSKYSTYTIGLDGGATLSLDGVGLTVKTPTTNVLEPFHISGLGQLIEAAVQSDRLMVFGD